MPLALPPSVLGYLLQHLWPAGEYLEKVVICISHQLFVDHSGWLVGGDCRFLHAGPELGQLYGWVVRRVDVVLAEQVLKFRILDHQVHEVTKKLKLFLPV